MPQSRKNRRTLLGVVSSDKSTKTITVVVTGYHKHTLYGNRVMRSKKYHVHDEEQVAHVGDYVKIVETRPLSATKRFRLLEIVKKATGE
jgi:small subunit ribosomal protein S17